MIILVSMMIIMLSMIINYFVVDDDDSFVDDDSVVDDNDCYALTFVKVSVSVLQSRSNEYWLDRVRKRHYHARW